MHTLRLRPCRQSFRILLTPLRSALAYVPAGKIPDCTAGKNTRTLTAAYEYPQSQPYWSVMQAAGQVCDCAGNRVKYAEVVTVMGYPRRNDKMDVARLRVAAG